MSERHSHLVAVPAARTYATWRAENVARIWNATVAIGQAVRFHATPHDAHGFATRTRGTATVRTGAGVPYAVVPIDGIEGAVPLDHLVVEAAPR